MTADLRTEADQIAAARPDVIRPVSRRRQLLELARAVKDEETDSPFFVAVSGYAVTLSWLPDDISLITFGALARAVRGGDMTAVSSLLNELCVDIGGAA